MSRCVAAGAAGLSIEDATGVDSQPLPALARAGWGAVLRAARELADDGSFAGLAGAAPFAELNSMFE